MTRKVVSPIALDKSINTTEQTPRNIADVLAQQLAAIKTAIESGNGNLEAAFVCYYGVTTATQIKEAIENGKVPYFYYNGVVAQLWKVETDKYTFRTTNTRSVEGQTILDVVDYVVNGSVWSNITREVSGGSSSGQSYIASVSSSANFDTTGHSGMHSVLSVNNVPADGIYQLSVMLHITPKTASATKSDLVFHFTSGDGTGWPNHTFHAVVDDSQTFAQQLSFSTSVSLKAGQNTLRIQCGDLNTEYLVFVDDLTIAGLIVGGQVVTSGTNIYPTLQDAISDASNLYVGDIFETNGFHTNGDGGAARYLVSDTGTANGMDIVQLTSGKLAVLQAGDWIIPEQLGYVQSYSRDDVVPYIQRAITIGCQHIHLISSGGKAGYTWKTKLTISVRGFKLTGEGDWGSPNKFSYVVFRPSESVTEMLDLSKRDVLISDIDFEVTGDNIKLVDGITCSTYDMDETRFWEFRNLRFNSFRRCMYLGGTVKWQNTIKDCLFNYCVTGIEIYESSTMQLMIENCQFIGCDTHDLLFNGNVLSAKMICCNFGSTDNAVSFKVNSSTYLYQNASFESCNFENDNADGHNRRALAIDLYDPDHSGLRQNITISNCHFVIGKLSAPIQDTTNRFIRLGDSTHLVFLNNQILGYNEPKHSTWVTDPKLLWDETSLPVNGGIVCVGESVSLDFPDALLPYLQRYDETPKISVRCRRNASEQGWGDCDTWLPDYDGQVKVCGVSTYDSPATQNLPISNTFGFLWVIGTISGAKARVLQRYEANNGNFYTRLGRGNNGVWTWSTWKTITAT